MKRVLILGATGSIGKSAVEIMRSQRERFSVCGMSAHSKEHELDALSAEFRCKTTLTSRDGTDGIKRLIDETKPDIAINGISGSSGLVPSILVLEAGIDLALANKESVVMAWPLIKKISEQRGARILPVDSEHSAIFTLMHQAGRENIDKIMITASGGPFRTYTRTQLETVTVQDALKHPTWSMGTKITIDSATLGNKGLEVIEASRLFDATADKIQVVIHPESVIHSLVRTNDGIVYGQFSEPDMKHPILQALDWPLINRNFMRPFDLTDDAILGESGKRTLTFEKPRVAAFPLLGLAFSAVEKGKNYAIAFNAANEVAVQAFIDGEIPFTRIADVVGKTMAEEWSADVRDEADVFAADKKARASARKYCCK